MESLKKTFLELLERDKEFRYTVAGYLGLFEILKRLDALAEEQLELRREQARLAEELVKLREDFNKMREDFNRMYEHMNAGFARIERRLGRVERTVEKLTLDIEEEARIVVRHRLKEMGYEVEIGALMLPKVEINIYGVSGDLCIIGESTIRASADVIDEMNEKIEKLKKLYPDALRPKILKVIYVCLALPDLIERAKKEGVWVLKATGDIVKPESLKLN